MGQSLTSQHCVASLVDYIYSVAQRSVEWKQLAARLAQVFRADAAVILSCNASTRDTVDAFGGPSVVLQASHGFTTDLLSPHLSQNISDPAYSSNDKPFCRRTLRDHLLFRECCRPERVEKLVTLQIEHPSPGVNRAKLSLMVRNHRVRYSQRDRQLVGSLLPHMERACLLAELRAENEALRASWLQLSRTADIGIVILDHKGACLEENETASNILDQNDGLCTSGERIYVRSGSSMVDISSLCIKDDKAHAFSLVVHRQRGDYKVTCKPLCSGPLSPLPPSQGTVMVLIEKREASVHLDWNIISSRYQTTPRETHLMRLLIEDGLSPKAIADKLGTSVRTVRTQLASIYGKTQTSGQKALIKLILESRT